MQEQLKLQKKRKKITTMENYNPLAIEEKWQFFFEKNKTFEIKNNNNKKFFA